MGWREQNLNACRKWLHSLAQVTVRELWCSSIHPSFHPPTHRFHPSTHRSHPSGATHVSFSRARGRISQDAAEWQGMLFPEPPTWSRHAISWKLRFRPSPIGWRSCETRFVPFDISRVGVGGGGFITTAKTQGYFVPWGPEYYIGGFGYSFSFFLISSKNQNSPSRSWRLPAKVLCVGGPNLLSTLPTPQMTFLKCGVTSTRELSHPGSNGDESRNLSLELKCKVLWGRGWRFASTQVILHRPHPECR